MRILTYSDEKLFSIRKITNFQLQNCYQFRIVTNTVSSKIVARDWSVNVSATVLCSANLREFTEYEVANHVWQTGFRPGSFAFWGEKTDIYNDPPKNYTNVLKMTIGY